MAAHAFETALTQPTHDASYFQFCTLISARDYSGPTLPAVAETYLRAFCNSSLSPVRRRWIGVALTGMLEKPDVAAHIQQLGQPLQLLGGVILCGREREVTRMIAGMIIRQALEQGIEYRSFWSSEKVRNSVPTFPQQANATWMHDFQVFLNVLGELALTSSSSQPSATHFISFATSDEFRVQEARNGLPTTILEDGILTIVAPDDGLQELQFVDIPVNHILSTRLEPSTLHNSQSRRTKNAPCYLVMTLKTEPWSYRLNSVQRFANEMSIMFKLSGDALGWQENIEQHQKEQRADPNMSRSLPIDTSSLSPRNSLLHRSSERIALKKSSKTSGDSLAHKSHLRPPTITPQVTREAESIQRLSPSKHTIYSKGKLPIVSQAAKQQALKQLNAQSDGVDLRAESKGQIRTISNTPSFVSPHQKLSQHPKAALGKKNTKSIKTRKPHVKRKVDDDDEDYIPEQTKLKKKMNAKRQSNFDAAEDRKQVKKPRVEPESHANLTDIARKRRDRYRMSVKPFASVVSSRPSLIKGLRGSQKTTKASNVVFKKPTLPTRVAQTPSTPTKPKKRFRELQERFQTTRDAKTPMNDEVFAHMPSSPPVACAAEEKHDWLQEPTVETEILSSNSKPVPASPNAESTAISGHADRDDVAFVKRTGDSQTAKSDPFTQRSGGKKNTSFIRRLTWDELPKFASDPVSGVSHSTAALGVWPQITTPLQDESGNEEELTKQHTICQTPVLCAKETDAEPLEVVGNNLSNSLIFTAQQIIDSAPVEHVSHENGLSIEDRTLVGDCVLHRQDNIDLEASSMQFHSSPPRTGSPDSHSSTSAESLSSLQRFPCSQIEEMDWIASLEPHQRNLHELLIRTSKRVMRHIVDNETSISEIANIFSSDGEHVLRSLMQNHEGDYERVFRNMKSKRKGLQMVLERARRQIVDERRRFNAMA